MIEIWGPGNENTPMRIMCFEWEKKPGLGFGLGPYSWWAMRRIRSRLIRLLRSRKNEPRGAIAHIYVENAHKIIPRFNDSWNKKYPSRTRELTRLTTALDFYYLVEFGRMLETGDLLFWGTHILGIPRKGGKDLPLRANFEKVPPNMLRVDLGLNIGRKNLKIATLDRKREPINDIKIALRKAKRRKNKDVLVTFKIRPRFRFELPDLKNLSDYREYDHRVTEGVMNFLKKGLAQEIEQRKVVLGYLSHTHLIQEKFNAFIVLKAE